MPGELAEAIKAFIPKIPEGAEVFLEHAPGISYRWENGKVVDKDGKEVDLDKLKVRKK